MAEGYEGGSIFMSVIPSFRGVVSAITQEFTKYGAQAGEAFSKSFNETVRESLGDVGLGPSDEESTRQGESAGGKFADGFRARVDAAIKSLPDASVDLNDEAAKLKLDDIRGRLETLRTIDIGVDLSDKDALAAVEVLRADLNELALKSPSIRVKVDSAAAIGELEAVKIESDRVSGSTSGSGLKGLFSSFSLLGSAMSDLFSGGDGGLKGVGTALQGVGSSLGEVGSAGPIAAGAVLALGTALIPIGGLAAGAALGLASIFTVATGGLGAFALAAEPIAKTLLPFFSQELAGWAKQFKPEVISVAGHAFTAFGAVLSSISPLVQAAGPAISGAFDAIGKAVSGPAFSGFIRWLSSNIGPVIQSLTKSLIGFGGGFASLLEHSGPLLQATERFLPKFASAFESFASSKTFQNFVGWVSKNGPDIFHDVESIIKNIATLIADLAPVGKVVLDVLARALSGFTTFEQNVIGVWRGIYDGLLDAWHWIDGNVIQPIEQAVSVVLPLAAAILQGDWSTAWGALKGIVSQAWQDLIPIIDAIVGQVNRVIGAIDLIPGVSVPKIGTISQTGTTNIAPIVAPTGAQIDHSGRAAGGPIDAGVPYIVGELGPELIVPRVAGDVVNNATLRSLPPLDLSKLHAGAAHSGDTNFNFRDTVIRETADVDMLTRTIDFKMRASRL